MTLKLDPNQQKAVEHFQGPALVVAGPGSGKTMVIKERILHLIRECNIVPRRILALAFNKEAAKEMEKRILSELASSSNLPEIRTLHAFGLRVINEHYDRLKRKNRPTVWAFDPERTIEGEIRRLKGNMANATVTIYKIENELTGKCYIGQTTNPKRRKREHFSLDDSSNPDLRQAMLNEGTEHFSFHPIDEVKGEDANKSEAKYIEYYKDCAVVKLLEFEVEQLEEDKADIYISIYKIESQKTGICYILQSTDSGRSEVEDFIDSSNDEIRNVIENEGTEHLTLEILHKEVRSAEASILVEHAVNNASSRSRAVFNRNDPLKQHYSDQLLIELFCEHFGICYEEFLKSPLDLENLTGKIEDFEKIVDKVQKAKQEINIDFSNTNSIDDVVNSIIESIDDQVVRAFAEKYEKKKEKANAIDFQDMILYAVYLLEVYPDIYTKYRGKYDYVLIDEFQDISPIDFRLIKPLSEDLFVVGDDDQAIYGFRGGNSEIMLNFHKRENVRKYKITRNYRSTSTIVEHSRVLIEHNSFRIDKNLHAENQVRPPIKILKTTQETVKDIFLREFDEPCCQTQIIDKRVPIVERILLKVPMQTQQTGIPVRYRSEVEKIRKMLLDRGFKEVRINRKEGDLFQFIGRGPKEIIEGSTIHKMKGKEYDKVILIHNTLEDKDFPFHDSDDITEDRRVFYVGITRAKSDLVILGGECQFVSEAGLSVLPSKRRKHLERISKNLQFAIIRRINIAKKEVNEISEKLQITLTSILIKHIGSATESIQRQCKYELDRLRQEVHKTEKAAEDASKQLETELITAIQASNENLFKGLIPVLDVFESQINNGQEIVDVGNVTAGFSELYQSLQDAQQQLLRSLDNHEFKPIEVPIGAIFNSSQHEEISPAIYSNNMPAGRIAREERRGYLLQDQVVRKAQVIISKKKQQAETPSDSSTITSRDTPQIQEQDFRENKIGDTKKRLRYYLRRSQRFAVEKIKSIFFKKSSS